MTRSATSNYCRRPGFSARDSAEITTDLLGIAGDLSSILNLDIDRSIDAISAAVTRGEFDALEALGITLNASAVQAKAVELGLIGVGEELDPLSRNTATYALIQEQSAFAAEDFLRTMDSLPNALKVVRGGVQELSAAFGEGLLDSAAELVGGIATELIDLGPIAEEVGAALGRGINPFVDDILANVGLLSDSLDSTELFGAFGVDTTFIFERIGSSVGSVLEDLTAILPDVIDSFLLAVDATASFIEGLVDFGDSSGFFAGLLIVFDTLSVLVLAAGEALSFVADQIDRVSDNPFAAAAIGALLTALGSLVGPAGTAAGAAAGIGLFVSSLTDSGDAAEESAEAIAEFEAAVRSLEQVQSAAEGALSGFSSIFAAAGDDARALAGDTEAAIEAFGLIGEGLAQFDGEELTGLVDGLRDAINEGFVADIEAGDLIPTDLFRVAGEDAGVGLTEGILSGASAADLESLLAQDFEDAGLSNGEQFINQMLSAIESGADGVRLSEILFNDTDQAGAIRRGEVFFGRIIEEAQRTGVAVPQAFVEGAELFGVDIEGVLTRNLDGVIFQYSEAGAEAAENFGRGLNEIEVFQDAIVTEIQGRLSSFELAGRSLATPFGLVLDNLSSLNDEALNFVTNALGGIENIQQQAAMGVDVEALFDDAARTAAIQGFDVGEVFASSIGDGIALAAAGVDVGPIFEVINGQLSRADFSIDAQTGVATFVRTQLDELQATFENSRAELSRLASLGIAGTVVQELNAEGAVIGERVIAIGDSLADLPVAVQNALTAVGITEFPPFSEQLAASLNPEEISGALARLQSALTDGVISPAELADALLPTSFGEELRLQAESLGIGIAELPFFSNIDVAGQQQVIRDLFAAVEQTYNAERQALSDRIAALAEAGDTFQAFRLSESQGTSLQGPETGTFESQFASLFETVVTESEAAATQAGENIADLSTDFDGLAAAATDATELVASAVQELDDLDVSGLQASLDTFDAQAFTSELGTLRTAIGGIDGVINRANTDVAAQLRTFAGLPTAAVAAFNRTLAAIDTTAALSEVSGFVTDVSTTLNRLDNIARAETGDFERSLRRGIEAAIRAANNVVGSISVRLSLTFTLANRSAFVNAIAAAVEAAVRQGASRVVDASVRVRPATSSAASNPGRPGGPQAFARGGIFDAPTFGLFGEAGREVILPVTDLERSMALLAASGFLDDLARRLPRVAGQPVGSPLRSLVGDAANSAIERQAALVAAEEFAREVGPRLAQDFNRLVSPELTAAFTFTVAPTIADAITSSVGTLAQSLSTSAPAVGTAAREALQDFIGTPVAETADTRPDFLTDLERIFNALADAGLVPDLIEAFANGVPFPFPDDLRFILDPNALVDGLDIDISDLVDLFGADTATFQATVDAQTFGRAVGPFLSEAVQRGLQRTNFRVNAVEGTLTAFARGGIVDRATPGVFGEAGREVLIPLTKKYEQRAMQLLHDSGLSGRLLSNVNVLGSDSPDISVVANPNIPAVSLLNNVQVTSPQPSVTIIDRAMQSAPVVNVLTDDYYDSYSAQPVSVNVTVEAPSPSGMSSPQRVVSNTYGDIHFNMPSMRDERLMASAVLDRLNARRRN